jgi:hypothetical protein
VTWFAADQNASIRAVRANDYRRIRIAGSLLFVRMQIGQVGAMSFAGMNHEYMRLTSRGQDSLTRSHGALQMGNVIAEHFAKAAWLLKRTIDSGIVSTYMEWAQTEYKPKQTNKPRENRAAYQ